MECLKCGYDMAGTPRARRCPECGVRDWGAPNSGLRSESRWSAAEWTNLVAASIPLAWLLLLNALLLVARIQLGHWPNQWSGEGPGMVPVVRNVAVGVGVALILVVPAAIVSLVIVGVLVSGAMSGKGSWRSALSASGTTVFLWAIGITVAKWDPWDALAWYFD